MNCLLGAGLQASDLCVDRGLVAAGTFEDLLSSNGIRLVDSVVETIGSAIIAAQNKSHASAQIVLSNSSYQSR